MALLKVVSAMVAGGGVLLAYKYGRIQHELKDAQWFRESALKVAQHKGVHELIGTPPLELGDVSRYVGCKYEPLVKVDPEPTYVLEVPIKGSIGEGKMRLYMNYLVPIDVVRKDINAWNVGLLEVQVGKNKEHRFVVQ